MPRRLSLSKRQELERRYAEIDTSGDHRLDFNEMKAILTKGNSSISDGELKKLYNRVDKNGDGSVDFDEFVAYLYDQQKMPVRAGDACEEKFLEFAGKEMDGTEFAKFCADCGLLDKNFRREDVAMTFMKVCPRGKKKIGLEVGRDGFSAYDKLLSLIAERKKVSNEEVQMMVCSGSKTSSATKADDVRFHDDKTLYTGSHAANDAHHVDAAKVASPKAARARFDIGPEMDWGGCEKTYQAFDGHGHGLDGRDFTKLCVDAGLTDKHMSKGECDVVFSKMRTKKLQFDKFQEALRCVAERRQEPIKSIQASVGRCEGPSVHATKADNVRFHDDKSMYTGTHAGK